jgi:hypothetical protein
MKGWTLDDVDWSRFDAARVDPETTKVVKASSLVEHNGADYGTYLCNVFHDDPAFQQAARIWAAEEIRHGLVLRRWAELADPTFDFAVAFKKFTDGYRLQLDASASIRGSRAGELVARCIVETGTSSWYSAIQDSTEEPVLRQICQFIAADELRHYKLFYLHLKRYLEEEKLNRWQRLRVAAGRLAESEDDELAFAYYAANGEGAYDRGVSNRAYARRAYAFYRPHHVSRGMAMIFKAIGLDPQGRLHRLASKAAWKLMESRTRRLDRLAA